MEAAIGLGMHAVQACWYLQEGKTQPTGRKSEFAQVEKPLDIIKYIK